MALSRKDIRAFLEDESLSIDEKVSKIAQANGASVDSLRDQIEELKRQNSRMDEMQRKLDAYEAESKEDWKGKYEKEHSDFESYKDTQTKKEQKNAKVSAYTSALKSAGVSEKHIADIINVTVFDDIELNKDGGLKNAEKVTENIKNKWSGFMEREHRAGVDIENPPETSAGAPTMSRKQIMAITDREERLKQIKANPDAFPEVFKK